MLHSRRKRYLSGSDWVINTLDRVMKQATCAGNQSQLVLPLGASPDPERLRLAIDRLLGHFPVLSGTVARDWKLTPYWRIPRRPRLTAALRVTPLTGGDLLTACTHSANRPFPAESEHLAFQLLTEGARSTLVMTFDHRLLDARGAEALLDLLRRSLEGAPLPEQPVFASSSELTRWREKFLSGRNVNRRIIALAKETPRALPLPAANDRGYRYRLIACGPGESTALTERAWREAGYLMESPFLLAVVTRSMHALHEARGTAGSCYLVPVTVDLRPGREPLPEIFFNHVSYLFYQLPAASGDDLPALISAIKAQMYEQVKSGFPADLARASLLMRIAPLPLLGKLLYLPLEGKMASFAFAHLGRSGFAGADFMGSPVENLWHLPRVPVPPGIGFFCNSYGGRLNLTMAYLDGLLSEAEAELVEQGIRTELTRATA
jgi:hypothetical protein